MQVFFSLFSTFMSIETIIMDLNAFWSSWESADGCNSL